VTVSAIGDAGSLLGGTLVMTPLNGADGQIYAVAQGHGHRRRRAAEGEARAGRAGRADAGVIPAGARVEREVEFDFTGLTALRLACGPRISPPPPGSSCDQRRIRPHRRRDAGFRHRRIDIAAARMRSPAHVLGRIENIVVEPEPAPGWSSTSGRAPS
jgi:flagellar P-ring protein FlgI